MVAATEAAALSSVWYLGVVPRCGNSVACHAPSPSLDRSFAPNVSRGALYLVGVGAVGSGLMRPFAYAWSNCAGQSARVFRRVFRPAPMT